MVVEGSGERSGRVSRLTPRVGCGYRILIAPRAKDDLLRQAKRWRGFIGRIIERLRNEPLPPAADPVPSRLEGVFRLHCFRYRIVYRVDRSTGAIFVLRIGTQGEVRSLAVGVGASKGSGIARRG